MSPYPKRLPAVRDTDADPGVANLLVMHLRIVNHDIQPQSLHRETANRGEQRVRSDDAIMLRGHQSHARIHQFLLRIDDVERCTLPDSILRVISGSAALDRYQRNCAPVCTPAPLRVRH